MFRRYISHHNFRGSHILEFLFLRLKDLTEISKCVLRNRHCPLRRCRRRFGAILGETNAHASFCTSSHIQNAIPHKARGLIFSKFCQYEILIHVSTVLRYTAASQCDTTCITISFTRKVIYPRKKSEAHHERPRKLSISYGAVALCMLKLHATFFESECAEVCNYPGHRNIIQSICVCPCSKEDDSRNDIYLCHVLSLHRIHGVKTIN